MQQRDWPSYNLSTGEVSLPSPPKAHLVWVSKGMIRLGSVCLLFHQFVYLIFRLILNREYGWICSYLVHKKCWQSWALFGLKNCYHRKNVFEKVGRVFGQFSLNNHTAYHSSSRKNAILESHLPFNKLRITCFPSRFSDFSLQFGELKNKTLLFISIVLYNIVSQSILKLFV